MILIYVSIIMIILLGALFIILRVQTVGEERIVTMDYLPKEVDAIIVLGAGIRPDGTPSDILAHRLKTSIEVKDFGIGGKLILSGDHGQIHYNEVAVMKSYIMEKSKVLEKDIFLDHAGFSTYETIYRSKAIFKVKTAIIVTNKYHLPRAIYIAKKLGLDVYGIASDKQKYDLMDSYIKRERIAQIKDFVYVHIFKPEPTFLGETIPVNSSDGRETEG